MDSELILNLFSNKRNQAVLKFKKSNQTVNEDMCLDDDLTFRLTDEEAKKEIEQLLPGIEIAQIKGMPKQQRDRILAGIKDIEGISHRQAARILGISVNLVHKA